MDLSSVNAIVTGGSRGLGRALAEGLARAGARVVVVARGRAALEATVAGIRAEGGIAHAIAADVGDKRAIHRIAGDAAAAVGPIDLVVHAASDLGPVPLRPLDDTECEDFERVLQVNLLGPFRLTKAVLGSMVVRGRGTIVDISSDAAVEAYPTWGAYGVSKAALDHLTRIWAAEVADHGVRLLAVDPGDMDTQMHHDAVPDADPSALADPRDVAARILDMIADPIRAPSGARLAARGWEVAR